MKIVKPTCINATSKSNAVWMGCHGGKGDAPPLLQALATSAGTQIKGTHSHTSDEMSTHTGLLMSTRLHTDTHTQVMR